MHNKLIETYDECIDESEEELIAFNVINNLKPRDIRKGYKSAVSLYQESIHRYKTSLESVIDNPFLELSSFPNHIDDFEDQNSIKSPEIEKTNYEFAKLDYKKAQRVVHAQRGFFKNKITSFAVCASLFMACTGSALEVDYQSTNSSKPTHELILSPDNIIVTLASVVNGFSLGLIIGNRFAGPQYAKYLAGKVLDEIYDKEDNRNNAKSDDDLDEF